MTFYIKRITLEVIKFKDNEGDLITIVKQEDLDIAIQDFYVSDLYLASGSIKGS
jgi:hypothetical protein